VSLLYKNFELYNTITAAIIPLSYKKKEMEKKSLAKLIFILMIIIPLLFYKTIYQTLFIISILHISITLPMITYFSKKEKWVFVQENENTIYKDFSHPSFILYLALAITYPLLWGLLLSLSRYFRLGTTVNIPELIFPYLDYITYFCFLIPFNVSFLLLVFIWIKNFRLLLWSYTEVMVFSFHLKALQYYDYFKLCLIIHKIYFIVFDLFFQYPGAYYKKFNDQDNIPIFIKFTQIIQKIYYKPKILIIIIFSLCLLELIIYKGKIYYSLYIFFFFIITISSLHIIHEIGTQNLIHNMCLSDYFAMNFSNPRYKMKFWFLANNPGLWYGFSHTLDPSLQTIFDKIKFLENLQYNQFIQYKEKLIYKIHGYKSNNISIEKTAYPRIFGIKTRIRPYPWNMRIAAFYKNQYGVRWYHTTRVLLGPPGEKILHPFTAKFLTCPYALLALLNYPGLNIGKFTTLTKGYAFWLNADELYITHPNILVNKSKHLINLLETNFVYRFKSLAEKGVIIGTYHSMQKKFGYNDLETMQQHPDMVSLWINNVGYHFKGYLAVDEKHKITSASNYGRHQALNNITPQEYIELLSMYELQLKKKYLHTAEISAVLEKMKTTALHNDFNQLLEVWAANLHLFENKWKPPLMLDNASFDLTHLKPEILQKIREGVLVVETISDKLYALKVCTETGKTPDGALDNMAGSFMQKLEESQ
jgi:hypothetical protein